MFVASGKHWFWHDYLMIVVAGKDLRLGSGSDTQRKVQTRQVQVNASDGLRVRCPSFSNHINM
jgi:hypothetical protein